MSSMSFKKIFTYFINLVIVGVVLSASFVEVQLGYAAAMTTLSDTQSSLKVSTLSDHTIQFVTPTGISAGGSIAITFPSGYATGTFAIANFDFGTSTSATCSGFLQEPISTSASGATWGILQATSTITIVSGTATIPANRCLQLKIGSNAITAASGTSQITNPSSPGAYSITIAASNGDTGTITQNIITDDTVSVSATVQQSISFSLSTTTIYFGNLSSGAVKYASSTNTSGDTIETIAHTITVSTNAPSGYNLSIRGQTLTSLQFATNTITGIGSTAASSTAGTEQFGIRATSTGGTGATIDPTYNFTTSYGFDASATTSAPLAVGSGATNPTTFGLRYIANIAGTTEAGTYTASLVYVATANF